MNDRFWEIVEQADREGGDDPDIRDEVFAQLIVEELAEMLEVEYGQSALTGNAAAHALKEHFGVGE